MEYFALGIGCVLLILAVLGICKIASIFIRKNEEKSLKKNNQGNFKTQKDEFGNTIFVRCPVCDSPLEKSGKMFSKIYRPMKNGEDQLMTVQGCNNCFPVCNPGLFRKCPVCKKNLASEDFLRARLFNRGTGKKHVLITGCNLCGKK